MPPDLFSSLALPKKLKFILSIEESSFTLGCQIFNSFHRYSACNKGNQYMKPPPKKSKEKSNEMN
jgi:hypothetical protein